MMKVAVLTWLCLGGWCCAQAQTVTTFEGIDASEIVKPQTDIDPNGAIGTKQYMEWVDVAYQAYDKVNFAPVWSAPQPAATPFKANKVKTCYGFSGDGVILFDRLASRWVIAAHNDGVSGNYYYCVAISNTDDLTSPTLGWYTYAFYLTPFLGVNAEGNVYHPDWPKLGTWGDAYYLGFDLLDPNQSFLPIGVVACALDRTNMVAGGTPKPIQCFSDPDPIPDNGSLYLRHSLIAGDVEGTTAPPSGRDGFFVSIQNPPNDGKTTTSTTINLWDFHVDWVTPANSSFTNLPLAVPAYTPGCYDVGHVINTVCVPEPSTAKTNNYIDSVGDRLMPRLAYRNFGSYESLLVSQTIQTGTNGNMQTGIRWYELRSNGSGTPSIYQSGTLAAGNGIYRFMPSIAQDHNGNAAAGFSASSMKMHPGIRASHWNLRNSPTPHNLTLWNGKGDEENAGRWGDYTSMTVDPVDDCTFWYVNEYFAQNQVGTEINWNTRISNFKIAGCKAR